MGRNVGDVNPGLVNKGQVLRCLVSFVMGNSWVPHGAGWGKVESLVAGTSAWCPVYGLAERRHKYGTLFHGGLK